MGEALGPLALASNVAIDVQRTIDTVDTTDIVIVPSVLLRPEGWKKGRYPRLGEWLRVMHDRGAVICSACSRIFLLAFCICPSVLGRVSGRRDSSRARARDLGSARGAGELGGVDDVA